MRRLQLVRSQRRSRRDERRLPIADASRVMPFVRAKSSKLVHLTSDVARTRFEGLTATSICGVWVGHNPDLLADFPANANLCQRCINTTDR